MSLVGNLISKIHDDLIKSLEMIDIFRNPLLGGRVCLFPYQSKQSLLVICDYFPGSTDGGKHFR